jgi:phage baseplate assembly protein V
MHASLFEYDGRVEEKDGQQFLSGRGLYGDGMTKVRRLEPHGFASKPPKGSQGVFVPLNGNPDEAVLLGVDHPDHRPRDLPDGGSVQYDDAGNVIKLIGADGCVIDLANRTLTATTGDWVVTAPSVTINGNVTINGDLTCSGGGNFGGSVVDGDGDGGA